MRKTILILVVATFGLSACGFGQSRLNPVNWFGNSRSAPVATDTTPVNPLIPRSRGLFARRNVEPTYFGEPFDQIIDLTVERVPGGALIRATGLAARQGIYEVQLTPANEEETPVDGVLTYRLEGVLPTGRTPVGSQPTREVTAARVLTDQQLAGVRSIRVEGLRNARVSRR